MCTSRVFGRESRLLRGLRGFWDRIETKHYRPEKIFPHPTPRNTANPAGPYANEVFRPKIKKSKPRRNPASVQTEPFSSPSHVRIDMADRDPSPARKGTLSPRRRHDREPFPRRSPDSAGSRKRTGAGPPRARRRTPSSPPTVPASLRVSSRERRCPGRGGVERQCGAVSW